MTEVKKVQIKVSQDLWEKLVLLKARSRAPSYDDVIRKLIQAYESYEKSGKPSETQPPPETYEASSPSSRYEAVTSELEDTLLNGLAVIIKSLRLKLHSYRPVLILLGNVVKAGELDYREKKKELEKQGFSLEEVLEHVKEFVKIEDGKLKLTEPFKLMLDVCELVDKDCREEIAESLLK